jgi:5,10-methylenetetrahydrofolate reductase
MAFSIECFAPRTKDGYEALLERFIRPVAAASPKFVSISGASPASTLELAAATKEAGVSIVQLQISVDWVCADTDALIERALTEGISSDVLILAPPHGVTRPTSDTFGYGSVLECIKGLKARFADKLQIAVCGYPRGSKGELAHYSDDIALLKKQLDAGASRIITMPVWDINHFVQYLADARNAGIPKEAAISPSVLPLHAVGGSTSEVLRVARALGWTLPKPLAAKLDALPAGGGTSAIQALGAATFRALHSELSERCKDSTPHVMALNAQASLDALRSVGVAVELSIPPAGSERTPPTPEAAEEVSTSDISTAATVAAAAVAAAAVAVDKVARVVSGSSKPAAMGGGTARASTTVHILFGGRLAREVSELVGARVKATGGTPRLVSMEEVKPWAREVSLLESEPSLGAIHAIFVLETIENEQPSEPASTATRYFHRKDKSPGMLSRLRYSMLGLGDSNLLLDRQTTSAKDCNQAAQRLDTRLAELGGVPFYARGEADDRTGNQEIEPWLEGLERACTGFQA